MYNYNYNPYFYKQAADNLPALDVNPQLLAQRARVDYQGPGFQNPVVSYDTPPINEARGVSGSVYLGEDRPLSDIPPDDPSLWDQAKALAGKAGDYIGNKANAAMQGLGNAAGAARQGLADAYNASSQWIKDNPWTAGIGGLGALAALGAGGYYLYSNKKKGEKSASLLAKEASAYFYKQAAEPVQHADLPPVPANAQMSDLGQTNYVTNGGIQDANGNPVVNFPWYQQLGNYLTNTGQQTWNQAKHYYNAGMQQAQAINNWVAQNPWAAAAIAGGIGLGGGAIGGFMAAPSGSKKKKR